MSDDDLRTVFRRIAKTDAARKARLDYAALVACLSDLSGEPRDRIHELCLDIEIPYEV